jgi:hypothetical protein
MPKVTLSRVAVGFFDFTGKPSLQIVRSISMLLGEFHLDRVGHRIRARPRNFDCAG